MDKYDEKAKSLMNAIFNGWTWGERQLVDDAAIAQALRESAAEAWSEAGDMSATYGAPVMRDDSERGFYVACENLRDEYRARAASIRAVKPSRPESERGKA